MNPNAPTRLSSVALLALSVTLAGCSIGTSFPDASANPEQNLLGTIQGSNYGGHAPIIGSHVYVLQPGITGYGSQATSLLNSTYSGTTYTTTKNTSDPGIPTTWYYETTDATGSFNITGDYTCAVGQPVYLYIYGGAPSYPATTNTVSISSVTVTTSTTPNTYTFTTSNQNAYVGESVQLYGLGSANNLYFLNYNNPGPIYNYQPTIIAGTGATALTNTSFSVTESYGSSAGTFAQSGATAVFLPTTNNAIVNMAMLGNCPAAGNFSTGASALNFVYVNEISTIAMAYAMQGFTVPATTASNVTNNNGTYIGTSSTNLLGLENAATTAGLLYNIQGGNMSTTYAGEGHIARAQTPGTGTGGACGSGASTGCNGVVPQTVLDQIGNIMAACVDSNNATTTLGSGGAQPGSMSTPCYTIFATLTSSGVPATSTLTGVNAPGIQPFDTAQAAINLARHPGGPAYTYYNAGGTLPGGSTGQSNWVINLFSVPTGNVPFAPSLMSFPYDYSVAITYPASCGGHYSSACTNTNSEFSSPEDVAVDSNGYVWVDEENNSGSNGIYGFSPAGVNAYTASYGTYTPTYLGIDNNTPNHIFTGTNSTLYVSEINASGASSPGSFVSPTSANTGYGTTGTNSGTLTSAPAVAVDGAGNVYVGYGGAAAGSQALLQLSNAGVPSSTSFSTPVATCFNNINEPINHIAIGPKGALTSGYYPVWLTGYGGGSSSAAQICQVNPSTGAAATGFTTSGQGISTATTSDEKPSIDNNDNAWVPSGYGATPELLEVSKTGAVTAYTTGATLLSPYGSVIDGANTVWMTDISNGRISQFSITSGAFLSPPSDFDGSVGVANAGGNTTALSESKNIAADPSGNLWVTDIVNNALVEFVGIAAPTITPISKALANGTVGTKP